ncbi:globin [Virgibacillus soli]|uniref:Globin n=1 Tax=Paracerasibacillus soli TaxID=480284 RepID=A0ABU5CNH9_9BACI|nr:globin [Virgibacillus soli]MDY0407912.1 globin [Virgibacillus soli]
MEQQNRNYPGTIFEAIGGADTIAQLVHHFYKRVGAHPDLIPIFPDDLTETEQKQYWFLTQFFGGPALFTLNRGHPMMRRRHLPFEITPTRRDAWLQCMDKALDETNIDEPYRTAMFERLTMTAHHMMNTPE